MQTLTFTNMTRSDAENGFDDSYKIEQLISVKSGHKVVYKINEEYLIEYIIFYALIRNGSYCEFIPITSHELHSVHFPQDYLLKDGYVGLITPDNKLSLCDTVEDNEHIDVLDIKKALRKTMIDLDDLD